MRIGSKAHKELFCRSFMSSHEPYEPEHLPWPELDDRSLSILRSLPVWSMALQVEVNAGVMIAGFADSQRDPLIQEALRLQGYEEARHGRMIGVLVERYQIKTTVADPTARPTRRAFVDFGYNECVDSFMGFGVFRIARQMRFLPDPIMSLFTRVLWEEARHIVFFVNWIAYERTLRGYGPPLLQAIPTAIGYGRALLKTVGRASLTRTEDKGLQAVGDILKDLTPADFLRACLTENDLHMARFDPRLMRPRAVPAIARFALNVIEAGTHARAVAQRALPARTFTMM